MIYVRDWGIGNWFIDYETEPERTIYWQVEKIEPNGVWYRNLTSWRTEPIPVPLTPEILEKCDGFRYYSEKEIIYDNWGDTLPWQIQYYKNVDGIWQLGLFVHTKQDFYEHVLTHIQYLHQLQNFIYLTFNTELNFKP